MKTTAAQNKKGRRITEAFSREREALYRALIETTDTGYVIIDPQGRVLDANPEYVRLSGHRGLEEIRGRSVIEWTAGYEKTKNAEAVKKCCQEGFIRNLEIDYVDREGRVTPVEINATVVRTDETARILSLCRDISERRRAERDLRAAHAQTRRIINNLQDAYFLSDVNERITEASPSAARIYGYDTTDEMLGLEAQALHADPRDREHILWQLRKSDCLFDRICQGLKKDGSVFWISMNVQLVRREDGMVMGTEAMVRDITERKQAEEKLRESEERYYSLFDNATDGMALADAETGLLEACNQALCRMVERDRDELVGQNQTMLHPPQSLVDGRTPSFSEHRRGDPKTALEDQLLTKSGKRITVEIRAAHLRIGGRRFLFGIFRDITGRKQIEEALRAEKELTDGIINTAQAVILLLAPDGKILYFNPYTENVVGRALSGVKGKDWFDTFLPERNRETTRVLFRQAIVDTPTRGNVDTVITRTGDERSIEWYDKILRDSSGAVSGLLCVGQDVTERERVAEALRQSEERFRVVFEHAADAILILEIMPEDVPIIRDANAAAFRILGYEREELINKSIAMIEATPDLDRIVADIKERIHSESHVVMEVQHRCKDGTLRDFECSITDLRLGSKHFGISIERDITQRKRDEEALAQSMAELAKMNQRLRENQVQLIQSEKMASFGQLAAGVAHEINNPVGFVMSNLGALQEYVAVFKKLLDRYERWVVAWREGNAPERETILKEIQEIRSQEDLAYISGDIEPLLKESCQGIERVKDIVQNLKSFVRLDEAAEKEADLNAGIETTLKVIWNELKYKCRVHKDLGPLPLIRCHPGQLNQVFMNLLVNAAQAIEGQGDIFIETRATATEIVIRVADTGKGIAPEHVPKLFTPFFTTKPAGKGTGLGLSISQGIIRKHNGTIQAESEPGKGTTFIIRLPINVTKTETGAAT